MAMIIEPVEAPFYEIPLVDYNSMVHMRSLIPFHFFQGITDYFVLIKEKGVDVSIYKSGEITKEPIYEKYLEMMVNLKSKQLLLTAEGELIFDFTNVKKGKCFSIYPPATKNKFVYGVSNYTRLMRLFNGDDNFIQSLFVSNFCTHLSPGPGETTPDGKRFTRELLLVFNNLRNTPYPTQYETYMQGKNVAPTPIEGCYNRENLEEIKSKFITLAPEVLFLDLNNISTDFIFETDRETTICFSFHEFYGTVFLEPFTFSADVTIPYTIPDNKELELVFRCIFPTIQDYLFRYI